MKKISLLITAFSLVQLVGCMGPTRFSELRPQVEQWEKEQAYGRSLEALAKVDPADPDYHEAAILRKKVEKGAADYELSVRRDTDNELKRGNWAAALDHYDDALEKYPQSPVIRDGLAKLHQRQRDELEQLERQRLLLKGEGLSEIIPIYQDLARVNPRSTTAQGRLSDIRDEAAVTARALAVLGNRALADNDLDSAEETLTLAHELDPDPVIEESVQNLRQKQQVAQKKRRDTRRRQTQQANAARARKDQAINNLLTSYEAAFAKKDYLTARVELGKIETIDSDYSKLPAMKRTLDKAIDSSVARKFENGVSAYSRGLFERAAREWREVLALDPNHLQAKENLDRAEKVLEKIDSLKQKQAN